MLVQSIPYPYVATGTPDDWQAISHLPNPIDGAFDFTGLDLTGFQRIVVIADDVTVDTEATEFHVRLYSGGALISSGYRYFSRLLLFSSPFESDQNSASAAYGYITGDMSPNGTGRGFGVRMEVSNVTSSLYKTICWESTRTASSGNPGRNVGHTIVESTATNIDGILMYPHVGAFTAGRVTVYGVSLGSRTPSPVAADVQSMWVGGLS